MRTRIALALLGLVGSLLAVLTAAPAEAALPFCTRSSPASLRIDGAYWRGSVPTTSSGSYVCQLGVGSVNSGVTALQNSLRRCNARSVIAVDGEYGPATKSAVTTFQRWYDARSSNDIAVDGAYGVQTGQAMTWYLTYGSQSRCERVMGVGGA